MASHSDRTIFTLPDLPYAYDALVPYLDQRTMELHHTKHHQGYVKNLNRALEAISSAPNSLEELLPKVNEYPTAVRNNGGGHYNHTFFWESLTPRQGEQPIGPLNDALARDFGTMAAFQESFMQQGLSLFGAGWTWLCANKEGALSLLNTPNQDNPLMDRAQAWKPILGIDLWEHAYYLLYQNQRKNYLEACFSIIAWEVISKRYQDLIA